MPIELTAQLLRGGVELGDLPVTATFTVDEALLLDEGRLRATVEGTVELEALALRQSVELCVFLLLDVDGEALLAHGQRLELDDFAQVAGLRYVLREDLPEGTRRMTFVVLEATSGFWGARPMEEPTPSIAGPGFGAVRVAEREDTYYELRYRDDGSASTEPSTTVAELPVDTTSDDAGDGPATIDVPRVQIGDAPRRERTRRASDAPVVRLVPPRGRVAGSTAFDVLTSSVAVDRVVFELDGVVVGEDGRAPFRERITLADPPREQVVRVVAYDNLDTVMGEDSLRVNVDDTPFRVRLRRAGGVVAEAVDDGQTVSVPFEIEVDVPAAARLERVELWRGEQRIQSVAADQLRTEGTRRLLRVELDVPMPPDPSDFVRAAAFLADGSSIDDVVLLAGPVGDEVDVNLVEVHVVVTDADGRPVTDLELDDFSVVLDGAEREVANFAHADDVPLILGLMVDSSGSMQLLMQDTRRAAAKFLGQTLLPQDGAFLVDFDRQPRLLHPPSSDLPALIRALGDLNADGRTAMYDAIIFSLLQYEGRAGRRALVVLSDGDDLDSRYGPKRVAERAQAAGVPVYLIGLGALDIWQRRYSERDLRRITGETGGRLYFVDSFGQLDAAYAEINAELRSQYTLSFYADRDLSPEQRREVTVRVPAGLEARAVVGVDAD
ncbi:MAG: VWA domain-containing protein [Acidobacteriota bacterium]